MIIVGLRLTLGGGGGEREKWRFVLIVVFRGTTGLEQTTIGTTPPNIAHENLDFARVNNLSTLQMASLVYFLLEPQPQLPADSYIEVVHC